MAVTLSLISCSTVFEVDVKRGHGATRVSTDHERRGSEGGRRTSRIEVVHEVDIEVRHLLCKCLLNGGELAKEQNKLRSVEHCPWCNERFATEHAHEGYGVPPRVGSSPGMGSLK